MSDDTAITAAADQAHAEAEHTLNKLITWWTPTRTNYRDRTEEVCALTYILTVSSTHHYSALLATAICRLTEKTNQ